MFMCVWFLVCVKVTSNFVELHFTFRVKSLNEQFIVYWETRNWCLVLFSFIFLSFLSLWATETMPPLHEWVGSTYLRCSFHPCLYEPPKSDRKLDREVQVNFCGWRVGRRHTIATLAAGGSCAPRNSITGMFQQMEGTLQETPPPSRI